MSNKISEKDKKEWEDFLASKKKLPNKDLNNKKNHLNKTIEKIDLHGYSLEKANNAVENFIKKCSQKNVGKIKVITGKGLHSNNNSNPYVSKDLSILKHSVPEFIKSNKSLVKMILEIKEAEINDGGSGAFYIILKKNFKE